MWLNNEKNWKLGFGADRYLGKIKNTFLRRSLVALIAFLVGCLFWVVGGFFIDKAMGYTPMQTAACAPSICESRYYQKKFATAKFKDGKMGRENGVAERALFKHPADARRIVIRKIQRKMDAMSSCTGTHCRTARFTHSARWYYWRMINSSSCFGDSFYRPWTFGSKVCGRIQRPIQMTNRQVKNTFNLIFCGAALAATVESGGSVGPVAIGIGSSACFWGFYLSVLPD